MSRVRTTALACLALLLLAAPFVPHGGPPGDALLPSGKRSPTALAPAQAAGRGELTPALESEVDRVVRAGRKDGRLSGKLSPSQLAEHLVRCATFEGQRYCLGSGWTDRTATDVRARLVRSARAARSVPAAQRASRATGDLDALALLRRTAELSPRERARLERAELTRAARSVAKVWLVRHQVTGEPLPEGFLDRHPEARASAGVAPRRHRKTRGDYPRRGTVLRGRKVTEQHRTYWCGPSAMQMIAWAWQGERRKQKHWARRLGTTSDGTAISAMVRVVNQDTGYDRKDRAGPYVVLDISHWSYKHWLLLQMRHVVDYRAPLVLHPVLLKRYYPYLDDDASGHFQVGRGYDKRGSKPTHIGYFEPWNQQRFDPSEPYIKRVQWRSAYKSFRANKDHFQQNIGV